ncbi:MAG TPA: DNA adenine methylase [Coleofasciculaceae cyanobacterium]
MSKPSAAKSPLRYPGGKSKAIDLILPQIPTGIAEFREPFVGGGSVFLAFKSQPGLSTHGLPTRKYWINDLNYDLCCFWKFVRDDIEQLSASVIELREKYCVGKALYLFLKDEANIVSDLDRAVRFFIMNRITFSGVMDSGGYSQQAFEKRFTDSSIARLNKVAAYLSEVEITYGDYEAVISEAGEDVFLFLDPPYWSATQSKLYGVKGDLHTAFDHQRFADNMKNCPHQWLITYDDSPEIRQLFSFADIVEWELQYGMNNYGRSYALKGKELFIKNF